MSLPHQDFKVVVFKRTPSAAPRTSSTSGTAGTSGTSGKKPGFKPGTGPKIRFTDDGEEYVKTKSIPPDEGKRLALYRTAANLTQKSLASNIGVKLKDLQDMESGKRAIGPYKMKLSRFLNVPVNDEPYINRKPKSKAKK